MVIALCLIVLIVIISLIVVICNKNTAINQSSKEPYDLTKDSAICNDCTKAKPMIRPENKSRRIRMYAKHLRIERHRHIWAVLRLATTIKDVYDSESFYDLDKSINEYKNARDRLNDKEYTPSKEEISIAIRFCKTEYAKGLCEHKLLDAEELSIYDWETFHINLNEILPKVVLSFRTYWDEVLSSYKRQSARKNRINYLINHITEMKAKENLSHILDFEKEADKLISYYKSLSEKV